MVGRFAFIRSMALQVISQQCETRFMMDGDLPVKIRPSWLHHSQKMVTKIHRSFALWIFIIEGFMRHFVTGYRLFYSWITMFLIVNVRRFWAILHVLPKIASHPRSNTL